MRRLAELDQRSEEWLEREPEPPALDSGAGAPNGNRNGNRNGTGTANGKGSRNGDRNGDRAEEGAK
jgi:hypothetical protein